MRGEDLRGMNIEELEQLEKSFEDGLRRLIKKIARIVFCHKHKYLIVELH